MEREEAQNWEWVLVGTRGERRMIKRKVFVQDRRNTYNGDKSIQGHRGPGFRRNHNGPVLTGANSVQLNRTSQASLNTRSSSQQSFPTRDDNSLTRDDRNVRFLNIRDHPIQRALTEAHRGSYVTCQGAATPPSPTVMRWAATIFC